MSLRTVDIRPKYGLIKKNNNQINTNNNKRSTIPIFSSLEEDSDNEPINDVKRVNQRLIKQSTNQISELTKNSIDNSDIYDYDGVYDSMKAAIEISHPLSRSSNDNDPPKARYIQNLQQAAKIREKENDRAYERKLFKERKELEGQGVVVNEESFITSAYKQKLIEKEAWEYEERLQEELDKKQDVRKKGMHGFYSNLLTKNIALGGEIKPDVVSAFTVGSQRSDKILGIQNDKSNIKIDSPVDNKLDSKADSKLDTQIDRVVDNNIDSKLESQIESKVDTNIDTINNRKRSRSPSINPSTSNDLVDNKADRILSAKERYLARKANQISN